MMFKSPNMTFFTILRRLRRSTCEEHKFGYYTQHGVLSHMGATKLLNLRVTTTKISARFKSYKISDINQKV